MPTILSKAMIYTKTPEGVFVYRAIIYCTPVAQPLSFTVLTYAKFALVTTPEKPVLSTHQRSFVVPVPISGTVTIQPVAMSRQTDCPEAITASLPTTVDPAELAAAVLRVFTLASAQMLA